MVKLLAVTAPLALATVLHAQTPARASSHIIPRFTFEYSGLVASGPARVGAAFIDEGRRAGLRGLETGSFDVYANRTRLAHDVRLGFRPLNAGKAIEAHTLAKSVLVRPEGITIVYSHPTFTVREHAFAPLNEAGALVIVEVATLQPLRIEITGAQSLAWRVDSAAAASQFFAVAFAVDDSVRERLSLHAREYWQEKAAHYRKLRLDGALIDGADPRIGQTLDWAKVALERHPEPQNVLAAIDLGEIEAARSQLINSSLSNPVLDAEWVRACYQYWLASGDDSFLEAYWPSIVRTIRLTQLDTFYAARLAALEAVQEMARAMKDHVAASYATKEAARAQQQLANSADTTTLLLATAMASGELDPEPAERVLQRIASSEFTADWGTRVLSRDHPRYDPLRWDRGAISTYVTGLVALADYRYHRPWAGFDLVRDIAGETYDFMRGQVPPLLSGAYYQVLSSVAPAALAQPVTYVSAVMRGLLGWEADAPNHAAALEPHLPSQWTDLDAKNLRVGRDRLDVSINRSNGVYSISLHRLTAGGPLALRVAPALPLGARVNRITVDDAEVPIQSDENAHDVHAVAEVTLTSDAEVAVHYDGGIEIDTPPQHTEVGAASHELKVLDFRRDQRDYLITVEGLADAAYVLPLRSGWRVRAVQGSESFEQNGDRVAVHLTMPGGTGFVSKTLRVHVNP